MRAVTSTTSSRLRLRKARAWNLFNAWSLLRAHADRLDLRSHVAKALRDVLDWDRREPLCRQSPSYVQSLLVEHFALSVKVLLYNQLYITSLPLGHLIVTVLLEEVQDGVSKALRLKSGPPHTQVVRACEPSRACPQRSPPLHGCGGAVFVCFSSPACHRGRATAVQSARSKGVRNPSTRTSSSTFPLLPSRLESLTAGSMK
eukprot:TRINITY_DN30626_c0_g1_i1.p1 TRINITY_DN30626_c0_g1~~TRINITY_DN30626_c0_g1_i1.p1  ORF type:complete len:202 (+),score=14.37 TRINITY_DN30626_c0_g1_i1:230-835(+)